MSENQNNNASNDYKWVQDEETFEQAIWGGGCACPEAILDPELMNRA